MYEIVRVLVYRLWVVSTFTVFSSFIIFWLYGVLTALMVLMFGIMGILYAAQDLLLYFPNEPPDSRVLVMQPSHYKLPFESIKLKTKDGLKIHMFLVLQASDSHRKPTMIFFHGNAGNMGQRLGNVSGFYHKLNINILVVEYRGYGLSEGAPSEPGLYVDAQSALEYLLQRSDIDNSQIIVFGRSLGGAVAIDLAARPQYRDRLWALIVENTFTSIPDMARVVLKWRCLSWLPMFCHKNKYMSVRKMCRVRASTLVVCGSRDALVPPRMSHALLVRCGAVVRRHVTLPGAHDDTWTCAEYYTELRRFLALLPPFAPPAWPRAPRAVHTV